ncbi:hypothetical protein H072_8951 [Dactylellina haptotyla CBS 200.50]|uniref:Fe2OG dioxygenase domain-containing protein n=1 Tax=Dactylellina haptotyla (strain CBS 200.50) TaxID=1284197 RepID=S8A325_DACHA|nr:hypothetical protein H072_8951 [Dactylellina haptotyla CBS 200.50]
MAPAAAETAVSKDGLDLPLIDFSGFLHGNEQQKLEVAKAMLHGFKNAGFVYIKNYDISDETVTNVFAKSAGFFARPNEEKDQLAWTTPQANRGYAAPGREKTSLVEEADKVDALIAEAPDLKETFEIGREGVDGLPNNWPDKMDAKGEEFTKTMKEFFITCKELYMQVMRSIALGMEIDESYFDQYTDGGDNNLRLLHYPPQHRSVFKQGKNVVRTGRHTDYGAVTLLFQDGKNGGLQVKSPQGTFIDAPPIPGTIVINSGDLLARWANDTIKSTEHQVVEPPHAEDFEVYPARYSIAYFCNPNFDKFIEAIPGTFVDGKAATEGGKKYPGINSGDYLVQRLAATFKGVPRYQTAY